MDPLPQFHDTKEKKRKCDKVNEIKKVKKWDPMVPT